MVGVNWASRPAAKSASQTSFHYCTYSSVVERIERGQRYGPSPPTRHAELRLWRSKFEATDVSNSNPSENEVAAHGHDLQVSLLHLSFDM